MQIQAMSKSEITKQVYELLVSNNRPYAINDILTQCGKELGKSAVQKAIDSLVSNEKLNVKTFGKTNIYFPKQNANLLELESELRLTKQKLAQAQNQRNQREQELKMLEQKLKNIKPVRTLEELDDERNDLFDAIRAMNEQLRKQEAAAAEANLTASDVKKIEKKYENVSTAYRKRKRICNDMLEAILEGYPKSKKALIEDVGVETDEAVGFNLKVKR